jgi:tetratricopeptide (TPR) repeat protein
MVEFEADDWGTACKDAARARRSLEDYSRLSGQASPVLCDCLEYMSVYMSSMADWATAKRLAESSLTAIESAFGKESDEWFGGTASLARIYYLMGQYERAEALLDPVVRHFGNANRSQAYRLVEARTDLARVYIRTHRLQEADSLLKMTLVDAASVPHGNSLFRDVLWASGELYAAQEQLILAELCLRESLTLSEKAHGATNPRLSPLLMSYATVLRQMGRREEAAKFEQRAEALDRQIAQSRSEVARWVDEK